MPNLKTAIQAVRALGFEPVALNVLYKIGLRTGYFRFTQPHPLKQPFPLITEHIPLPEREAQLATLGETGLAALTAEADEIVSGKFRQFGGELVELRLTPPGRLRHWTSHETSHHATDIKLTWEPARFGWAFMLGRAYHATGNESYAAAFWRYFEEFSAANPPLMGPNWMSGQEVGIRLMAFQWAARVFSGSEHSTPARITALAVSMAAHADRIPSTLLYARSQNNNHLLTEAAALYTASLALPEHPHAAAWKKSGMRWLNWCFENQIDSRGEYVQHSTNYHRLMLQTALWVNAIDAKVLNARSRENLAVATHWLLSMLDPTSGGVPNLGANDGAILFPLANAGFTDFRPVVNAAARAFLYSTLTPGAWDEMALWCGLPRSEQLGELGRTYPGDHIYADQSWAMLRAIQYTSRPSHADQLHFDLWWRGLNITPDAGTYHYNAAPPWDNALTSTLVHNTVSVNGTEQMTRASRFLYLDWADAKSKQHFETGSEYLRRFSAATEAYARFGVRHEREATVFPDERWHIKDTLTNTSGQAHTFRLHWLLPDWGWSLENTPKGILLKLESPLGPVQVKLSTRAVELEDHHHHADAPIRPADIPTFNLIPSIPPSNLSSTLTLVRAGELLQQTGRASDALTAIRGWVSPTYSVKNPALSLAIEVESAQSVEFYTEFTFPRATE